MRRALPGSRVGRALVAALGVSGALLASVVASASPAGADEVINGCTIVSNPTPQHHTACPGANLTDADLTHADLSGTDLSAAILFPFPRFCHTTLPSGRSTTAAASTRPDAPACAQSAGRGTRGA